MNLQPTVFYEKSHQSPFNKKIDIANLAEKTLPPSAGSMLRLSSLLRNPNESPQKITAAVCYEPMLVTSVLRLINSPIYCLEKKVTSIQTAIGIIGNQRLREMVMMVMTATAFGKEIRGSLVARKTWEHSIAVAIIARELTAKLNLRETEESFTCGLLHDIGKLLLLSHDFEGFSLILDEQDEQLILKLETEKYGYGHDEIGSSVARYWKLQEEVCRTIRYHHDPFAGELPLTTTHILKVADNIANAKGYGWRRESEENFSESKSVVKLGLSADDLESVWKEGRKSLEQAIKMVY